MNWHPDEPGYTCRSCHEPCTRREAEMGRCDACAARRRIADRIAQVRADCEARAVAAGLTLATGPYPEEPPIDGEH